MSDAGVGMATSRATPHRPRHAWAWHRPASYVRQFGVADGGEICYHPPRAIPSIPTCRASSRRLRRPVGRAGSTLPERNTLVRDQLVIHGDFPLAAHHRLFEELTAQRADLCRRLALPCSDEPIHVYLFETPERFRGLHAAASSGVSRSPGVLRRDRRAGCRSTPSGATAWRDDLRHEVTHGYLHSVVPDVPLWLDEGIAKFYEVPRGQRGLNRPLLDRSAWRGSSTNTGSPTCGGWSSSPPSTT